MRTGSQQNSEDASTTGRPIAPSRLRWLENELAGWVRDGVVTSEGAASIRSRYTPATRVALVRIVVGLGAAFLAVGLLWLVATNLDRLPPGLRFAAVVAIWLIPVVLAEVLQARAPSGHRRGGLHDLRGDDEAGPTPASVCHVLAAAAFGAVIFQAAQSLQVPAYEPRLVGLWSVGALLYAYATSSRGALGIALAAGTVWLAWFTGESAMSTTVGAVMVLAAGVVATGVAAAHLPLAAARPGFASLWRFVGAGLLLAGVFIAALPFGWAEATVWPVELIVLLAAAAVAALGALALLGVWGPRTSPAWRGRSIEIVAALAVLALGGLLAWWRPDGPAFGYEPGNMTPEAWGRTAASLLVFVLAAAWYAVLGARREEPEITAVALVGLVVFTTVQSFAVFAPIASGATLFLVVGTIMVATGLAAERLRRLLTRRPRRRRAGGTQNVRPTSEQGGEPS